MYTANRMASGFSVPRAFKPLLKRAQTAVGLQVLGIGEKLLQRPTECEEDEFCGIEEIIDDRSLPERYIEGRIAFHVHIGIRSHGADPDLYNVCAVFYPIESFDLLALREFQMGLNARQDYWEQHPVLVELPEGVEQRQQLWAVPSLVRLAPLDERNRCIADPIELPVPFVPRLPPGARRPRLESLAGLRAAYGEGVFAVGFTAAEMHDLPNEVIKRRAKIVDDLSDDDRPASNRVWLPSGIQAKDVATGSLISLHENGEGHRILSEALDFGIQRSQLIARTVNLRPNSPEDSHQRNLVMNGRAT